MAILLRKMSSSMVLNMISGVSNMKNQEFYLGSLQTKQKCFAWNHVYSKLLTLRGLQLELLCLLIFLFVIPFKVQLEYTEILNIKTTHLQQKSGDRLAIKLVNPFQKFLRKWCKIITIPWKEDRKDLEKMNRSLN
jgi:hypothetical protein